MIKEGIFVILATFLFLCSCDKAETMYSLKMNDGKILTILPTSASYKSEKELLQQIPFIFSDTCVVSNKEGIKYQLDSTYNVTGVDQTLTGTWICAKFGEWIQNYGLSSNETYYIAPTIYCKYLEMPPSDLEIEPIQVVDDRGYVPDKNTKTFNVTYDKNHHCAILKTDFVLIGYDSNGNKINLLIPNYLNNLTWKFSIRKSLWD